MKKRILFGILLLILALPLAGLGLLASNTGSRWLLEVALAALPAQTKVSEIEGNLLEQIKLTHLHYESADERIAIEELNLAWQPMQLLAGRIKLIDIQLNGVDILIKPNPNQPEAEQQQIWNSDFWLPLQLILENGSITNLHYQDGDTQYNLQQLKLSAFTQNQQLNLNIVSFRSDALTANADAHLSLSPPFRFSLKTRWQLETEGYGRWQTETLVQGDRNQLTVSSQQSAPFLLNLQARLDDLNSKPLLKLRGDWQKLRWPLLNDPPQLLSEHGYFELNGGLDEYRLTLAGPLTQDYLPGAKLDFSGTGGGDKLHIEQLQITGDAGALLIQGNVDWQSATLIDLNASAQNFNPAIFLPQFPGNLSFDTQLQGELGPGSKHLQLAIKRLDGALRGNPLTAHGLLSLTNDNYLIKDLNIQAGRNHIQADGVLGTAESDLQIAIDAPKLAALWPELSGSLTAHGQLRGDWRNPFLTLQADAKTLHYQNTAIKALTLAIDYQPGVAKNSTVHIEAQQIQTPEQLIAAVTLAGSGTLAKHRFSLALNSPIATLSSRLNGAVNGVDWLAQLDSFDLDSKDSGKWHLQAPVKIETSRQTDGFQADLADGCLIQNTASVCIASRYLANSDFEFKLGIKALSSQVFKAFLPVQWQLQGLINADAEIQKQQGRLSGEYHLHLPDNKVLVLEGQSGREIGLGRFKLDGKLSNTLISNNAELDLPGQDYLRTQFSLNTDASQALSGQIQASLSEWSWLKPLLSGVSALDGHFSAELKLQGSISAPLFAGNIELTSAKLEMADAGFGLEELHLSALATSGRNQHISLTGGATPKFLPTSTSEHGLQFSGKIDFLAELETKQDRLRGHYQCNLPANSSLEFKNGPAKLKLPFAASSISGDINGQKLSADINLAMPNQDYLRTQLAIDTGPDASLSGHLNASLANLAAFNALLPELSETKGLLKADMAISGTTRQPVVQGFIRLSEAATQVNALGLNLQDIDMQILNSDTQGQSLQLTASAKSGNGSLQISGTGDLLGKAELKIQGIDFELAKLPEAQVSVSPDLILTLNQTGGKLSGHLKIPQATVSLQEIPQNAVSVSADEIILGQTDKTDKSPPSLGLDMNLDLELGDHVHFSGQGLKTDLQGRLKFVQLGDKANLNGTIDMKNARYQRYGQDLVVRKGRFLFNGPVDSPWLDLEATRMSKDQTLTAILSLTGPLKTPKTRIYSEPTKPEAEALAYLITGSSLNQIGKTDSNLVAGAALSYGVGQMSWLTEKLGVDEFEVKQGKTLQDTLLSVGQYLSPDFYVGTKVGIFNQQAVLVLKHKLSKSFNIETQAGTSQRIKLNYEIDTN